MSSNKKRGRPSKNDTRHEQINTKLNSQEMDALEYLHSTTGMSKPEFMRTALLYFYGIRKH